MNKNTSNFTYIDSKINQADGTSFIVEIPTIIKTKEELMKTYFDQLQPPYFGDSWDSLDEILIDLNWIQQKKVVIIHNGLPQLSEDQLRIYVKILDSAVAVMKNGPTQGFVLPRGDHDLEIIFPINEKTRIEKLLSETK